MSEDLPGIIDKLNDLPEDKRPKILIVGAGEIGVAAHAHLVANLQQTHKVVIVEDLGDVKQTPEVSMKGMGEKLIQEAVREFEAVQTHYGDYPDGKANRRARRERERKQKKRR